MRAQGAVYVSAAGNYAAQSYESSYTAHPTAEGIRGGALHDFGGGDFLQQITVPIGTTVRFSFQWDQPFRTAGGVGSASNYDFLLYGSNQTTVLPLNPATLTGGQDQFNIGNDALEFVIFRNNGTFDFNGDTIPDTVFNIAFEHIAGPAAGRIKYVYDRSDVVINQFATNSPTLFGHANAAGAIAVGAALYLNTPEFDSTAPIDPPTLENFSALGGTNILFDVAGNRLAQPAVRDGVDVVGPDDGNTTFFGRDIDGDADMLPNFPGTSASAPHVAGLAALLLQQNPSLSPAGIELALKESAIDMDNPFTTGFDIGNDAATGHGFVDALGALGKVIDVPQLVGLDPNEYILVNTTNDATDTNPDPNIIDVSGDPGNQVSLRASVVNANLATSTQKTILVPSGTYNLTLPGAGGDMQGDLDITRAMSIIGAGAGMAVINATGLNDRIFDVATSSGSLNALRLTLTGGTTNNEAGGAIRVNDGSLLNLIDSAVVDNKALGTGGNVGGGIFFAPTGRGTINRSAIVGNTVSGWGGGLFLGNNPPVQTPPTVTMTDTIVANNIANIGTHFDIDANNRTLTSGGGNRVEDHGPTFTPRVSDYVGAVDMVVTGLGDTSNHADDLVVMSIRDAIDWASGGPPAEEIWLPAWHFVLTLTGTGAIAQGDLDISTLMTIRGVGAGQTIVNAGGFSRNNEDRIFDVVANGVLNLSHVTLTGGKARGNLEHGGAILVRDAGTLHLDHSAIMRNETLGPFGNGGAIYFEEEGGGSITDSVISGNHAIHLCGGLMLAPQEGGSPAKVSVTRTIVVNNTAAHPDSATVQDVLAGYVSQPARAFTSGAYNRLGNETTGFSNGVNGDYIKPPTGVTVDYVVTRMADSYNHVDDPVTLSLRDAIDSAETTPGAQEIWVPAWRLRLNGTTGLNNGDLDIATEMTIRGIGPGATIIDADRLGDRHFEMASGGNLELSHVTLALGEAPYFGSRDGGAIHVGDGGHLILEHSAIVGNSTGNVGEGGGIYFAPTGSGEISNSVITVNEADYETGGIYLRDGLTPGYDVMLTNTIVANNTDSDFFYPDVFAGYHRKIISEGNNRLTTTGPNYVQHATDYIGSVDYVVTSIADTYDGTSDPIVMSLRDATHLANTAVGADEIWLPAWVFRLTREGTDAGAPNVAIGDVDVTENLTIRGIDLTDTTVDASAIVDAAFDQIGGATLTLDKVTVIN